MKTRNIFFATATSLIIAATFPACKKTDVTKNNKVECAISTVTTSSAEVYNFTYTTDGKPFLVTFNNRISTYSYSGNTRIITTSEAGSFFSKSIATLNAADLAVVVRDENKTGGWDSTKYDYNGDELVKATTTRSIGGTPQITTYSWFDHNMVSATVAGVTIPFGYYTDKSRQTGDYLQLTNLLRGYEVIRNKNLLKSVGNEAISYEFGADGKVASLSVLSGNNLSIINYGYTCK